jgi:dTDP-4-amino-4,6-dideoxygalactose transaminase
MIPIAKPRIGDDEKRAVEEVLDSGVIAQGQRVGEFEFAFADYIGSDHAIAASSGTAALHLALLSCGVGKGDEVITTPFSFIATANAILYCGATPVFADINKRTFNIDPGHLEKSISERTKAVLVVHLYGQPCEMDSIQEICEDNDLKLIEDACQAHGASYKGKKAGNLGDCGVFSFYPTKNMTTGEGGIITTNDAGVADKSRLLREHGSKVRYHHEVLGFNYRMTDIAAAIGLAQLDKLESFNQRRIENAKELSSSIEKIKGLIPPFIIPDVRHVFHQYTLRVTDDFHLRRDEVVNRLSQMGVGTGIYYPVPIHKQPFYKGYEGDLRVSEAMAKEVLSLPVHPGVSTEDLAIIEQCMLEF